MVRGCAAHFGFALVSRGSPGLPFVASCLPPVDRPRPVARSKPGLHTSFLPTTTSTSFFTQRDFNANPEETKNVFPTACHRLLPSLPCLSPSLQPGWGKSLKLNKVPSSREVYLSWLMTHRYKEVEYYKWIFHQSTISSPSEESGPHHSLATLLYSVLMQVTDAILYDDHDVAALRRDLPWFCQLFTSGGGWRCRYIRSSLSSKPMWHCINIC